MPPARQKANAIDTLTHPEAKRGSSPPPPAPDPRRRHREPPLGGVAIQACGFADDVAALIGRKEPGNLYDAVVSSQFDADRLDYMQRDRMMTGVTSNAVDMTWLLANLEAASVAVGADEECAGSIETVVLGPKAAEVAESYVLSLFHLYPNAYLHKATRGAEML